ncbi:RCC1/BLIP-II [Lentinula edodes]|nr:RCC1/BLIP-II [Lentinula edodes]
MSEGVFGLEPGAGIVSIAAGGMHTLLLDEKGTIWSAGVNDDAALGRITEGDELSSNFHPVQALIDEGFRAVRVVAGDNVSAAVSDRGELRIWGTFRDHEGQNLFANKTSRQFLPVPILNFTRKVAGVIEKVTSIACGDNHIVVLTTHGNVYTWGMSEDGRLGRRVLARHKFDATVPQKVVLGRRNRKAVYLDRVVSIAGGEHHTLFLTSQGKVYACGRCDDGQLGLADDHEALGGEDGGRGRGFVTEPVLVDFPDGSANDPIVHIAVGPRYNMAATRDGVLFSWGFGPQGELGLGNGTEPEFVPKMVTRREVSCGGQHVVGLFQKRN